MQISTYRNYIFNLYIIKKIRTTVYTEKSAKYNYVYTVITLFTATKTIKVDYLLNSIWIYLALYRLNNIINKIYRLYLLDNVFFKFYYNTVIKYKIIHQRINYLDK